MGLLKIGLLETGAPRFLEVLAVRFDEYLVGNTERESYTFFTGSSASGRSCTEIQFALLCWVSSDPLPQTNGGQSGIRRCKETKWPEFMKYKDSDFDKSIFFII